MATPNSEKSYVLVAQHAATLAPGRVTVNPRNAANPTAGPVSDLLYAGFLEHLGRCIYGGIVDSPKQPSPPDLLEPADKGDPLTAGRLGWRKDVMDLISKQGDLEIPMLRWPGGECAYGRSDSRQFCVQLSLAGRHRSGTQAAASHRAGMVVGRVQHVRPALILLMPGLAQTSL
jgi:hypothetical protein